MIPLRDNLPKRRLPLITLAVIAVNLYVFWREFLLGARGGQRFLLYYGLIPCGLTGACQVVGRAFSSEATLLTSMFVHAGFFHLAGNMLYLWIFGASIEDALGKGRFLLFYLLCGIGAAYVQVWANPGSRIPMVGASGAISGVLGAYLRLYPHARILTVLPLGFFLTCAEISALVVLGFWIFVQVANGFLTFNFDGGGVAWLAHVGGFALGLLGIRLFRPHVLPRWTIA
jgi:membrane associated rhomboid family serine protease